MTERNRAWRRRKARTFLSKLKKTQEWIAHQFKDQAVKKPVHALKQHRHDSLTHAQDLRLSVSLNDEIHDRAWQATDVQLTVVENQATDLSQNQAKAA